jgi:cysteinyl-tRNA synthetase
VRAQVNYDVLRRWLTRQGLQVTLIRNVTDIDDKILEKSAEVGSPWWAHAFVYEQEFTAAYRALNVLPPTYEPRATGHVTEMLDLVRRLVDAGHAYPAGDGSGDVYFDVRSFPEYGTLTRQSVDDMEVAVDADPRAKNDPHDFALWKGRKSEEPDTASWPSPWGRGRPGWHLECSVMATRYLGTEFDIHGGGLDLRFPHHENEQAQSRAAGDPFARYWLHNAMVVIGGEKMSKSLGNSLSIPVLVERIRPVALRYLLVAAHYRSNIEIGTDDIRAERFAEATAAYERIEGFVRRAHDLVGDRVRTTDPLRVELPEAFTTAMNDDLGTSAALAVVHEHVRRGNAALAERDVDSVARSASAVRAMADVLGIDPLDPHWDSPAPGPGAGKPGAALDALVRAELDERAAARARRDWTAADAIRDRLAAAGVVVEDAPDGARWSLEDGPR